jgi:hypothetical protein
MAGCTCLQGRFAHRRFQLSTLNELTAITPKHQPKKRDSSLITTGSKGKTYTNPKRQRKIPQVSCGAMAAPSLTLRVSYMVRAPPRTGIGAPGFLVVFRERSQKTHILAANVMLILRRTVRRPLHFGNTRRSNSPRLGIDSTTQVIVFVRTLTMSWTYLRREPSMVAITGSGPPPQPNHPPKPHDQLPINRTYLPRPENDSLSSSPFCS